MPSTLPSSFASAAAGNSNDPQSARPPRGEGGGGFGDWVRPRNGATQTFRRSSNAPAAHQRDSSAATPQSSHAVSSTFGQSSHSNTRNGAVMDTRYSRDQLLHLYRDQRNAGDLEDGVSHLYVGDSELDYVNGQSHGRWSRRDDAAQDGAPGPDICWDRSATNEPLGLTDMTDEEREWFTTSVNSPLKAPNANPAQREGPGTRKLSLSHATQAGSSPAAGRSLNRRRDPSDAVTSPKIGRDDNRSPPPSLSRRRTDIRDSSGASAEDRDDMSGGGIPFGGLKRTSTGNFGGLGSNGPSSPWTMGPQSAGGLGSMGSFGSFALGSDPIAKGRPGPVRAESRFKGLMSRDSADDIHSIGERGSSGNLATVDESHHSAGSRPVGSAALGGDSPPQGRGLSDYISSQRQRPGGDQAHGIDSAYQGHNAYQSAQQPGNSNGSPTFTNPYQSPEQAKSRLDETENDAPTDSAQYHLPGLGGFGRQDSHAAFNDRMANVFDQRGYDRSQSGSAMGNRNFPGLTGLGGLGGLGATDPSSVRSPGTLQSPAIAGLGGASFGAAVGSPGGLGSIGRGASRLGSLFPSGMQDQMRPGRGADNESEGTAMTDENAGPFGNQAYGQMPARDTESPFRGGRGKFDDFFGAVDKQSDYSSGQMLGSSSQPLGNIGQPQGSQRMPSNIGSAAEREPPAAQQKTMVMPDRIRWIYRDPQGNTQGPWTGLEMHDWYRAGFFSPELLVKKYEDQDYEPLAQLIRRIGNSREPFLVPQIGIPGPVNPQTAQAGGQAWPAQTVAPPPQGASQAQPPFANNFPSFGTTLTAEQQNALERRKQEEQYLMARQKEHLAQQQIMVKHMQAHGGVHGQGLQHHSSAQSLQSQPSYGSITSPTAYNAQLMQGLGQPSHNVSGNFDNAFRGVGAIGSGLDSLSHIKEEDVPGMLDRLNLGPDDQQLQQAPGTFDQAIADRARLQQEQNEDQLHQQKLEQVHGDGQRLKQFQDFSAEERDLSEEHQSQETPRQPRKTQQPADPETPQRDPTLTEQIQKAASAKQSPAVGASPWASIKQQQEEPTTVAPPQSSSPLPAPAARRNQKHVAEQLTAESISQSASPSVETPSASIAPWARDSSETQKQPSLKEIQEAEARRAAKQEAENAAARRAALDREIAAAQAASAPAPGLPTSSTWGNLESPSLTTSSPWGTKAPVGKSTTPATQAKKTLQQIQKEEEALARKQKAAALAALTASGSSGGPTIQQLASGKRYVDLASKVASSGPGAAPAALGSGWSTVGASGKAKAPAAPPGVAGPSLARTVSGTAGRSVSATPTIAKPTPPSRNVTGVSSAANPAADAMDTFRKWAINELRPDLNKGMDPAMFVNEILLNLPADSVAEAVHQSSQTMDSRHFAEEFVRRRTLAEKGKTVPTGGLASGGVAVAPNGGPGASGWSEVARKGPAKGPTPGLQSAPSMEDGMFKVVPAKKKGGKK